MHIKQHLLEQQLQKKIVPLYILIGTDHYLMEESLITVKSAIKKTYDFDEKIISIQSSEDWMRVIEEAGSYSLFSEFSLLNIFYDKKSIDSSVKKIITEYLSSVNSRCFLIIRAPNISAKQVQWLYNHEHVVVVTIYSLNAVSMKNWIKNQFKRNSLNFEPPIIDLIYSYTHGNMLACAQTIEKIALANAPNSHINTQQALEHLSDQCAYTLFELIEACLLGQAEKALHILRQAAANKTEPILILWMLTQEIRLLLQLSFAVQQGTDFKAACNQLKIWPQRVSFYQARVKGFTPSTLQKLLYYCKVSDEQIKSNLSSLVWNNLEQLSLSLCEGKLCIL